MSISFSFASTSIIVTGLILASSPFDLTVKKSHAEDAKISAMCCDWDGEFRINLVPDPYKCFLFYQCEPKRTPDGKVGVGPTQKECPMGNDGNLLYYDFVSCKCRQESDAICYDDTIEEHYNSFFNCTEKFLDDGVDLTC